MIWTLQIAVSILFFLHKVFIFAGRKTGWLLGITAATLATFYFYAIGLYVYTALEIGLIILFAYGFFKQENKAPAVESLIRFVTMVVMSALAIFAFNGLITIIEFISSIGLVIGTYLLTHQKVHSGWALYCLAHTLAAVLGYSKGQYIFAFFQAGSAVISAIGSMRRK